ncbi:hypothetical protein FB45DRAFT_928239 [Roridomyces roridus]|uniref:RING-type domain-containing protein n=1 Tax=Roridomyces roridus TaxID=1738132 RepID=A0AAD7BHT7_9AGAR|nr:hypothetical protein FB45DRAFT_928239 [Roridomyces roridus]
MYHNTRSSLDNHNATKHARPFYCNKCKTGFVTQTSLDDHYRGKPGITHPNCARCGKGFYDGNVLEEHLKSAHPMMTCCSQKLYEEDLGTHYKDSDRHPSCNICGIGFKDDSAYAAHGASQHPENRCTLCARQFNDSLALRNHFLLSPDHPNCHVCGEGYYDDVAFAEHHEAVHKPALSMNLLAIEAPKAHRLPSPGQQANDTWRKTENTVVSFPYLPQVPTARARAMTTTTALVPATTTGKQLWGAYPLDGLTDGRFHFQPQATLSRESPQAMHTPRASMHSTEANREFLRIPNKTYPQPQSQSRTLTPRSSTSSFQSSSYGESSDGSVGGAGVGRRATRSASTSLSETGIAGLKCMVCGRTPPVEPAATVCGHVFCLSCVRSHQTSPTTHPCPKCGEALQARGGSGFFRLHLAD